MTDWSQCLTPDKELSGSNHRFQQCRSDVIAGLSDATILSDVARHRIIGRFKKIFDPKFCLID